MHPAVLSPSRLPLALGLLFALPSALLASAKPGETIFNFDTPSDALALNETVSGAPVTIHGDGGQTRDFVFVKDVVAANLFAATKPGLGGVFNVGYGGSVTIRDLADRILAAAGSSSVIEHAEPRAGDVRHSRASADKLHAAGWRPRHTLESGLAETLAWYRAHADPA